MFELSWRKRWDSNPRKLSLHTLSKRAGSAALALFQVVVLLQLRVVRLTVLYAGTLNDFGFARGW